MRNNRMLKAIVIVLVVITINGCKKKFLNEKPSTDIVQPTTLDDMSRLMENVIFGGCSPALPIASSDEYQYKDYNSWRALLSLVERNAYVWQSDLYQGQTENQDWSAPYQAIFYTNNVIAGLDNMPLDQRNTERYRFIKGWAYFNRAYYFYTLALSFCKSYDSQTATNDLGLPLKTSPNINIIMQRSTLKETYEQILQDLSIASQLLEQQRLPTEKKNRPSLSAVYALQARMYLNMREYDKAELAADNCLSIYPNLIDYNTVKLPSETPFPVINEETIYAASTVNTVAALVTTTFNTYIKIDESVLNLYEPDDLRFKIYFLGASGGGGYVMNRNYFGIGVFPFTGLATDEVYLIKAECAARKGDVNGSMTVLNKLLINRFPTSKFIPKQATSPEQAFEIVIKERRKELVWRGARWEDLKRLNKEGANITITRLLNGVTYSLLPNDPKYTFPIPPSEIAFSGITQNLR